MEEGARADFVRLTDLTIAPCHGCFRCLSKAGACALEDDVAGLLDKASAADALVLTSPVYFGLPPAVLVGLLDRLLVAAAGDELADRARPAVTVTIMGNSKWRGVAEPFVNLAASLLGFEVTESFGAVAEGPGEVLGDAGVMKRLAICGHELGQPRGRPRDEAPLAEGLDRCPVCRSDFFRAEAGILVCPVCGAAAELAAHAGDGRFVRAGDEARWGRAWLRRHVAEWIRPSIERYKPKRKQVLRDIAELKRLYSLREAEDSKS
jgi:uncharacterized Zn finger protein (UPF0148 family)